MFELWQWTDAPADRKLLKPRTTHLFQCKLPALPKGQVYDPDKLYFRYTSVDGAWSNTVIVCGSYNSPYSHAGQF